MRLVRFSLLTISMLATTACSDGKYAKMSDSELSEKNRHCKSVSNKSTVFATGCENVRKEIERRKEERRKKERG